MKYLLILLSILWLFFVRLYKVEDISMQYSLNDGDIVLVENLSAGVHIPSLFFYIDKHIFSHEAGIHRGDVMAFHYPLDSRLYLKRVVALPNDSVYQHNKDFYLQIESNSTKSYTYAKANHLEVVECFGEYWLKNPYQPFYAVAHLKEIAGAKEVIEYPKTRINEGEYFFMGDFRDNSTDSRFFGAIAYDNIYYKVWGVLHANRTLEQMGEMEIF